MRCALVLISLAASEGLFRDTGFKSAGFDRCAISLIASRPGRYLKKLYLSAVAVGLRWWESRTRFPSLVFFTRRPLQAKRIRRQLLRPPTAEADMFPLWPELPMPCAPVCWPGPP